ncbi:MAG TPA: FRG domain-containing protein [Longimicrobium sp.]|jgi:hypothetical protein|uniref:FRG domain-containing protein n=1 Tax=Longimicrobium sp. TaxID=2029185 RepID=UPI002ED96175
MTELAVASLPDFHRAIKEHLWPGTLFRGVNDAVRHVLKPSLGRYATSGDTGYFSPNELLEREREALYSFSIVALPYVRREIRNDLELMTIAQHHGLPTRLLDWTFNPLVGLYFAVSANYGEDGAVFAIRNRDIEWYHLHKSESLNPFTVDRVFALLPYQVSERVNPQASVFTIHPDPTIAFEPDYLFKFVIPASAKLEIEEHLSWCGIHAHNLFPGLDGVSNNLKRIFFDRVRHGAGVVA